MSLVIGKQWNGNIGHGYEARFVYRYRVTSRSWPNDITE